MGVVKTAMAGPGYVTAETDPLTGRIKVSVNGENADLEVPVADSLTSVSSSGSSTAAISTTAVSSITPSVVAKAARITSTDLKPPTGCTTDAAGYAAGTKTINLAAAGTGTLYAGDVVSFAGQSNEYTLLSGDSDVSNGGGITLAGAGLAAAIPAATTAVTLVRRGARIHIAANCENDVEGLIATQSDRRRDASMVLGDTLILDATSPITMLHFSASASILINTHRIDVCAGEGY